MSAVQTTDEEVEVCSRCFEAVVVLYRGMSESVLKATCGYCGRKFRLEGEDGESRTIGEKVP